MTLLRITVPACAALATTLLATDLTAATVDEVEIELQMEHRSGLDAVDAVEQEFELDSLAASQPVAFSSMLMSDGATSQAGFNAAVLYDGEVVSMTLNQGILLSQTMPDAGEPATLEVSFDGLDLEAEENDPFEGFLIDPFTLAGTIAEGGFARLFVDMELEFEGRVMNVDDREFRFDRTFTSNFEMTSAQLFGAEGLIGIDLAMIEFNELELSGTIWFEVLGGETVSNLRIVTPTTGGTGTEDEQESDGSAPEPSSLVLAALGAGLGLCLYKRRDLSMIRTTNR